eukprot:Awhi_evm1s5581
MAHVRLDDTKKGMGSLLLEFFEQLSRWPDCEMAKALNVAKCFDNNGVDKE